MRRTTLRIDCHLPRWHIRAGLRPPKVLMNVVALLALSIVAATDAAEHQPDLTDCCCCDVWWGWFSLVGVAM
jgi:hypothetical protein